MDLPLWPNITWFRSISATVNLIGATDVPLATTLASANESAINGTPTANETACQPTFDLRNNLCIVTFSIIFLLSVVGNSLVVVTVVGNRRMRTATNMFLLNLAIADLLLAICCLPPTVTALVYRCFFFGNVVCRVFLYFQPITVCASAHTLVVIAVERYFAICRPLHARAWQTKRNCMYMLIAVWTTAAFLNIPFLVSANLVEYKPAQYNCRADWPVGFEPVYLTLLVLLIFVLPLAMMSFLYVKTCMQLWMGIQQDSAANADDECKKSASEQCYNGPQSPCLSDGGSCTADGTANHLPHRSSSMMERVRKTVSNALQRKQSTASAASLSRAYSPRNPIVRLRSTHAERNLLQKRRVINMLTVIVVEFFIFWTPMYAFQLMKAYVPDALQSLSKKDQLTLQVMLIGLSYLSVCSNPITYCFMNNKFRQAFLVAFRLNKTNENKTSVVALSNKPSIHHNSISRSPRWFATSATNVDDMAAERQQIINRTSTFTLNTDSDMPSALQFTLAEFSGPPAETCNESSTVLFEPKAKVSFSVPERSTTGSKQNVIRVHSLRSQGQSSLSTVTGQHSVSLSNCLP